MIHLKGTLQYDANRGVIYFTDEKTGLCTLRIEGVRNVPDSYLSDGYQIDIHLVEPGCGHHHENCGNRRKLMGPDVDPGAICAVKLEEKS